MTTRTQQIERDANALAMEIVRLIEGKEISVAGIALTLALGWVMGEAGKANGGKAEVQRLHDGTVGVLGDILREELEK